MRIDFLGTGAADYSRDIPGEFRAFTSTLLDGTLLIDATGGVKERIKDPASIKDVIYTHSHRDHFDMEFLKELAPVRAHMHASWAEKVSGEGVEVVPFETLETFKAGEFEVTALPSNHYTEIPGEQTVHFLIKRGAKTIFYATDGAWLMTPEWHALRRVSLDAAIFDATIGDGNDGDFRIFEHNSLDMLRLMLRTLKKPMFGKIDMSDRIPPIIRPDTPVFLTHLARTLHPCHAELEKALKGEFIPAYDGMSAEI